MACTYGKDVLNFLKCGDPEEPPEGNIYLPYVEIKIKDLHLYCGNESYFPDPHKMAIKSMNFGVSSGNGGLDVDFVIIAEGAKGYKRLVKLLNKSIKLAKDEYNEAMFRFGWQTKKCDDVYAPKDSAPPLSPWIYVLPLELSTDIDNGIATCKLKCKDILQRHFVRRIVRNEGDDANTSTLKEAVEHVCKNNDPELEVEFRNKDLGELEFEFAPGGIKAVWQANELPLLSTLRNWLSVIRTKDEKGIFFMYDPTESNPKLVIQEDMKCGNGENCDCDGVIASYIVNGGNCSPVISFKPTINWILDGGGYGGHGGSSKSGEFKSAEVDPEAKPKEASGSGVETPARSELNYQISPGDVAKVTKDSDAAHTTANKDFDQSQSIKGELILIGDASYHSFVQNVARFVSILVLSPYAIESSEGECTWIANPNINTVLSNRKWMIKGASHEIEAGKFITKLTVELAMPNGELKATDPAGGPGSGGDMYENTGDGKYEGDPV